MSIFKKKFLLYDMLDVSEIFKTIFLLRIPKGTDSRSIWNLEGLEIQNKNLIVFDLAANT